MAASPILPSASSDHGPVVVPDSPPIPIAPSPWWRIADFGVLALWVGVVAFILPYHEKWADEAQAWLIARDLPLSTIWFHELRYEGSPGLWHTILWIAQHVFHAHYDSLGLIGAVGALAGVALLIFKAPFPRYIRWPLAFTYFMVYQYAVIARPYTLMPLFAFAAAVQFKDRNHPERMTIVLVLLANLSLHGTILAGCLGFVYLLDAVRVWNTLDAQVRKRYWISVAVMLAVFAFIVVILKPTPDVEEFALKREIAALPESSRALFPTALQKLGTVTSGAFLDWLGPSVVFVSLTAAWCFTRRRTLVFALPVAAMIGFYAKVHGAPHHHGTAFIAAVTALWIAWPDLEERRSASLFQRRALQSMAVLLLCMCVVNVWDAGIAINREYLYPYSGAADAANYLKSVGADGGLVFGFLMGIAGVEAYFDHKVFANTSTTYFHHGLPLVANNLDVEELRRVKPDYVVAYTQDPESMLRTGLPLLTVEGYQVVHFSDGYYLYKRAVFARDVYFILRRVSH
jgi:hypothetical protein